MTQVRGEELVLYFSLDSIARVCARDNLHLTCDLSQGMYRCATGVREP